MFNILKNIIINGKFQLDTMKTRLENFAAHGDITPEQKEQLLDMARANANAENEIDVRKLLLDHEARIRALEERVVGGETDDGEVKIYNEYVVGTPTNNGDHWSWKGVNYTVANVPKGHVCVWSPEDYPAYWVRDAVQPE